MTVTVKVLILGKIAEATHKEQLLVLKNWSTAKSKPATTKHLKVTR